MIHKVIDGEIPQRAVLAGVCIRVLQPAAGRQSDFITIVVVPQLMEGLYDFVLEPGYEKSICRDPSREKIRKCSMRSVPERMYRNVLGEKNSRHSESGYLPQDLP